MPWYRTGTVAITAGQTTVTGTGTAFALNARVGDAFQGPDGRWYEVTNIASATVLSILPAYLGETVSAGAYGLAPMQGYVKDSADALRSIVTQYGAKLAALGTTGNYDVLPLAKGGTGIAADSAATLLATLGAMPAAGGIGLNPVFANLRAVQGASPSAQGAYLGWNEVNGSGMSGAVSFTCNKGGGTGGFSWRTVNASNTVGGPFMTYSEAGVLNVPAGIQLSGRNIVESGTNSSGTYVRYADGTQVCYKRVGTDTITGAVVTNIYASNAYGGGVFPAAFVAAPTVMATASIGSGTAAGIWAASYSPSGLNEWGTYRAFSTVPISASGAYINLVAIGRWY